jgi:hypothetical protein
MKRAIEEQMQNAPTPGRSFKENDGDCGVQQPKTAA